MCISQQPHENGFSPSLLVDYCSMQRRTCCNSLHSYSAAPVVGEHTLPAYVFKVNVSCQCIARCFPVDSNWSACRIVAANCDGFLSAALQRDGRVPDSVLTFASDVSFYFTVDPYESDYPVVADFLAWRFPDTLHDLWLRPARTSLDRFRVSESAMSAQVKGVDGACILSGFKQGSFRLSEIAPTHPCRRELV